MTERDADKIRKLTDRAVTIAAGIAPLVLSRNEELHELFTSDLEKVVKWSVEIADEIEDEVRRHLIELEEINP